MRKHKRLIAMIIAAVLAVMMLFGIVLGVVIQAGAVGEDSISELKGILDDLARTKQELAQKLTELNDDKADLMDRKEALELSINAAQEEIDASEQLIAELEEDIAVKEIELADAILRERERYEALKLRLRAMYESGETGYLELMLSAQSIGDFLARATVVSTIASYDQSVLEGLREVRDEIDTTGKLLKARREDQQTVLTALEARYAELDDQYVESDKMLVELESQLDTYVEDLESAEAAEDALNTQINRLVEEERKRKEEAERKRKEAEERKRKEEEERKRKEAEAAAKATNSANPSSTPSATPVPTPSATSFDPNGAFIWPLPGYTYITSPFGEREHPVMEVTKVHKGVDVRAPRGAQIVAAADGTVLSAGYNGGFGNCVIISHGGGVVTLYAHMSKIQCKTGASISQGDNVGQVGSTGMSTGNHLHFEIRIDGVSKNPMDYFNS